MRLLARLNDHSMIAELYINYCICFIVTIMYMYFHCMHAMNVYTLVTVSF